MKEVTIIEFKEFLKAYPRSLESGWTTICDPPVQDFLDCSLRGDAEVGSGEAFTKMVVARMKTRGREGSAEKYYVKDPYMA